MSDQTPETSLPEATPPAIPSRARTIIYIVSLAINALVVVGFGLATTFNVIETKQALEALTVILGGLGILSNGLAVGYRPTRQ